jgi:hypothetical protein
MAPDGREIARQRGFRTPEEMLGILAQATAPPR